MQKEDVELDTSKEVVAVYDLSTQGWLFTLYQRTGCRISLRSEYTGAGKHYSNFYQNVILNFPESGLLPESETFLQLWTKLLIIMTLKKNYLCPFTTSVIVLNINHKLLKIKHSLLQCKMGHHQTRSFFLN